MIKIFEAFLHDMDSNSKFWLGFWVLFFGTWMVVGIAEAIASAF